MKLNADGTFPMWVDPTDGQRKPTAETTAVLTGSGAGEHTHPESEVTDLTTDLAAKAAAVHTHDYAETAHSHTETDVTSLTSDLAGKAATGHTHSYAATSHTHTLADGDIPAAIARDAEVTSAIETHAATPHGGQAAEAFPVGSVFIAVVSTNPATLLGYGTWAAFAAGRVLIGNDGATYGTDEATGGAATAAISAHAATAVADHAALTHSGATVANHTDVTNHVHVQSVNSATTGGLSGYTPDTSTNTSATSGYSTANPTSIGVAAMVHTVGQASQHAAQSHSVTQPSAHTDVSTVQPYIVVHMWKRTA